jgi:mannosyltransferase
MTTASPPASTQLLPRATQHVAQTPDVEERKAPVWLRADLIAVTLITLAGAILRFATLSQSVWFDEAGTVREVSGSFAHVLSSTTHGELTPPIYLTCLWLWRHVFGNTAADMRALSALAGTAMIPLAFVAAKRLFGSRTGLVAAALVASSSMLLYYSQELRTYTVLSLLCGLGFLAFLDALEHRRNAPLARWAVLSLLALATQYYAWLVVVPEALILLVQAWRTRTGLRAPTVAVGSVGVGAIALLALAASQYTNANNYMSSQLSSPFQPVHFNTSFAARGNVLSSFGQQLAIGPGGPAKGLMSAAVVLVVIGALVLLLRHPDDGRRRRAMQLLLLAAVGALVAAAWFALGIPIQGRYLLPLWLPATLAIAYALSSPSAGRIGLALAAGLCVLWLVVGILSFTDSNFSARENIRGAARALGVAHTNRLLAIDDAWDLLPLNDYRSAATSPTSRVVHVTEVDLISMPTIGLAFPSGVDHPAPALPSIGRLPRSLVLQRIIRGSGFVIERFTSPTLVSLRLAPGAGTFNVTWRFLLEGAGARISGL